MQVIDRTSDNLDGSVPCCPGWTGRDLLRHVALTPSIWGTIMATAPGGGFPELDMEQLSAAVPADDEALAAWARGQTSSYAEDLRHRDPASWAYNIGPNTTAWMWMRRAAAEMAVHQWDAESIGGSPGQVPARLAADGLDELTEMIANFVARTTSVVPPPITAVATDFDGKWTFASPPASAEPVIVRGAAGELFLRLWGRPAEGLSGAVDVLDEWACLPFAAPPPRED